MYIYDDEKAVLEMERQRLGEYLCYDDDSGNCDECCECGKSGNDVALYRTPSDELMCLACAADDLYSKLYNASDCLDAEVRELYECSLCYCDFEEFVKEEYVNER